MLHLHDLGAGRPTLLLHGFTGAGSDWLPFLELLPNGRRYLAPDLRGHGHSPNPGDTYTHRQSALDVFALLDELQVKQFDAIGMSGGAMALLHMATQQPERVERMVLVSPTTHYAPQARAIMVAIDPNHQPEAEWATMRSKHHLGDDQIRDLWRLARAFKDDREDMNFQPADLHAIQAQTLVVHGDHDPLIPLEIAETIRDNIPHCSLWVIEGGGHVPVFGEMTTDFFARASSFLTDGSHGTLPS